MDASPLVHPVDHSQDNVRNLCTVEVPCPTPSLLTVHSEGQEGEKNHAQCVRKRRSYGVVLLPYLDGFILGGFILHGFILQVVDFGCSECRLQGYVRSIEGMEEVTGVDLDPEVLQKHKYDIGPDCTDYMDKR